MSTSQGQMLEKAIFGNPDDLGAHAAYADWLIEQGDPRGEFIQVQLALEAPNKPAAERKNLQKREKELLTAHARQWLGPLAEHPGALDNEVNFTRGWIDSLHVRELTVNFARAMVRFPNLNLMRQLTIEDIAYYSPTSQYSRDEFEPGPDVPANASGAGIFPLLAADIFANLRTFQFGEKMDDAPSQGRYYDSSCGAFGEQIPSLVARMPRIEELYLFANELPTGELFGLDNLQRLRVLQVYHAHVYDLETLAQNPALGNLTHLLFHPKALGSWSEDPGPYIKSDGVRALLNSPHLQRLTHLQLRLTDIGDAGCQEIVNSGILQRLERLDLRHGCITDDGARILARHPGLAKLQHLDVSRNALTDEGVNLLKKVVPSVAADYQQSAEEVESREYLFEGDIE